MTSNSSLVASLSMACKAGRSERLPEGSTSLLPPGTFLHRGKRGLPVILFLPPTFGSRLLVRWDWIFLPGFRMMFEYRSLLCETFWTPRKSLIGFIICSSNTVRYFQICRRITEMYKNATELHFCTFHIKSVYLDDEIAMHYSQPLRVK